jgi:hypothetical protein
VVLQGRRLVKPKVTMEKAIVLYAIGIPLENIQRLIKIKSETLSKRLLEYFSNDGTWLNIMWTLEKRFRFFRHYADDLETFLIERKATGGGNTSILLHKAMQFKINCKDDRKRQAIIRHASAVLDKKVKMNRKGILLVKVEPDNQTETC